MNDSFAIVDLRSQATAVEALLRGKSIEQKIAWLSARASVAPTTTSPGMPQVFWLESNQGLSCAFFFDGDDLILAGDHTFYHPSDKAK